MVVIKVNVQPQVLEIGATCRIKGRSGLWKVLRKEGDFTYSFEQLPNRKERRANELAITRLNRSRELLTEPSMRWRMCLEHKVAKLDPKERNRTQPQSKISRKRSNRRLDWRLPESDD